MYAGRTHLLRLVIVSFCMSLLTPFMFSSQAHAASNPITILSETYTITFPKAIDFQIRARDNGNIIKQASIFILSDASGQAQEMYNVLIDQPASTLSLQWHEDTSSTHFFPPGSDIKYYWLFQDSTGSYYQPQQEFHVVDTRFTWQHLSQGQLQVNWYNRPTDFGQIVMTNANTSLARITDNLGGSLLHPINLWIYQNDNDFRGSLPPSTHEWVGGIAFPSLQEAFVVVQDSNSDTLRRDMPHEMTHLVFHQRIEKGISAPTWFDEGLAVYNQQYHEPEMAFRFKEALAAHTLLRLNTLYFEFPADADQAYLAYSQSWNLIDYMYTTFGKAKMANLIRNMNNPQLDFVQDVTQALGEDQAHLENNWHVHLNQPPTLTPDQLTPIPTVTSKAIKMPSVTDSSEPVYLSAGILLILLSLGGIVGVFLYQQRNRRKIQVVQQAQQIINSSLPIYDSRQTPHSYTDQARYMPPQPDQRYPQNMPRSPYMPLPQQEWNTPLNGYAIPPNEQAGQTPGEVPPLYMPGQEYLNRRPPKQAPQE